MVWEHRSASSTSCHSLHCCPTGFQSGEAHKTWDPSKRLVYMEHMYHRTNTGHRVLCLRRLRPWAQGTGREVEGQMAQSGHRTAGGVVVGRVPVVRQSLVVGKIQKPAECRCEA